MESITTYIDFAVPYVPCLPVLRRQRFVQLNIFIRKKKTCILYYSWQKILHRNTDCAVVDLTVGGGLRKAHRFFTRIQQHVLLPLFAHSRLLSSEWFIKFPPMFKINVFTWLWSSIIFTCFTTSFAYSLCSMHLSRADCLPEILWVRI